MSEPATRALRFTFWCVFAFLIWGFVVRSAVAQIPPDAVKYKRELIRNSHSVWGLDAPISTFGAQIHQESGWRADVVSSAGAVGLAQFTGPTANWISGLYVALQDNAPSNPTWALRALIEYDKWLYERVPPTADHCERMAFVLSSYNGGMGNLQKDVALTKAKKYDSKRWFGGVELHNGGRAQWAFDENHSYPTRILKVLEPRYRDAGWGMGSC